MAMWFVHNKGGPKEQRFEIAIMRADNHDGMINYGKFGKDKLLVTHDGGGPSHFPITEIVWGALLGTACMVCDKLNADEIRGRNA